MGSKARVAKEILPIILSGRGENQWYVEPFCGGCNTIDKVRGNRIAADNNKYLIAMWDGLSQGRQAPYDKIDKALYDSARNEFNLGTLDKYDNFEIGWIGFMGSANGRFFDGGYSGTSNTKIGTIRDYIAESIGNIKKQLSDIAGVNFVHSDYYALSIPDNSIIYCDIPYCGTKQYSMSKGFNHAMFWDWCRDKSRDGHKVYVSEYSAPKDFECVWEKPVRSSLSANGVCGGNKISTERLFVYNAKLTGRGTG